MQARATFLFRKPELVHLRKNKTQFFRKPRDKPRGRERRKREEEIRREKKRGGLKRLHPLQGETDHQLAWEWSYLGNQRGTHRRQMEGATRKSSLLVI